MSLWGAATGLVAGYCGLAATTAVAVLAGGTHRPAMALALLAVVAFAICTRAAAWVAVPVGLMGWLFYDGFIAGRHARLVWNGPVDARWLGLLVGCAIAGAGARWLHDRLHAVDERRTAGDLPAYLANLADLAQARAARRGLCR